MLAALAFSIITLHAPFIQPERSLCFYIGHESMTIHQKHFIGTAKVTAQDGTQLAYNCLTPWHLECGKVIATRQNMRLNNYDLVADITIRMDCNVR